MTKRRIMRGTGWGEEVSKQRLIDANVLHDYYNVTDSAGTFAYCNTILQRIDDAPTIPAIPMDWMDAQIHGYASRLKSTELKALVLVKQMWEREQENQNERDGVLRTKTRIR